MSILGSMRSGVSGLAAQSNAFSAISDNISNLSTVGYKGTNTAFKTLVTKQTSSNAYSSGGVQSVSRQEISTQGLLSSSSSSTDLAISGNGYFVVSQTATPGNSDIWAYTRAGSFTKDTNGYLRNSGGFYAQAWNLLPWDGSPEASVVNIQGINYMKAYYNTDGQIVYINDNIIDPMNLKPINLATIGGTATSTTQVTMGANLPASDMIGSTQKLSALIYDSLGNASNLSIEYSKEGSNHWGMGVSIPSGAANIVLSDSQSNNSIYYSAGQLEFSSVPTNGSQITITDVASSTDYVFEFVDNVAGYTGANIPVANNVPSVGDVVDNLAEAIKANLPSGNRFTTSGNSLKIVQSIMGGTLKIDASKTLACVQSAANPDETTGIPTGIFEVVELTQNTKNGASITFSTAATTAYTGAAAFAIGGKYFKFVTGSAVDGDGSAGNPYIVNIDGAIDGSNVIPAKVISALKERINALLPNNECYVASGNTLEIIPTTTSAYIDLTLGSLSAISEGTIRSKGANWVNISTAGTVIHTFDANWVTQQGAHVSAILFNSDGTPKSFGVDGISISWANGAKNMNIANGNSISVSMGNVGTSDGFTQLSGDFSTSYIKQDGAKFGNYSGVSVDEKGIVTAVFDNGETRPIAILPLATFSNPNGMVSLTGNVWLASDESGQAMLKQAGSNGAGEITSYSLEDSTVDLANELSNMVVVQRAYSASTKIITTADEMLDELTRMV